MLYHCDGNGLAGQFWQMENTLSLGEKVEFAVIKNTKIIHISFILSR